MGKVQKILVAVVKKQRYTKTFEAANKEEAMKMAIKDMEGHKFDGGWEEDTGYYGGEVIISAHPAKEKGKTSDY